MWYYILNNSMDLKWIAKVKIRCKLLSEKNGHLNFNICNVYSVTILSLKLLLDRRIRGVLVGRTLQFSPCANAALPWCQRVFPCVRCEPFPAQSVAAALSDTVEKDLPQLSLSLCSVAVKIAHWFYPSPAEMLGFCKLCWFVCCSLLTSLTTGL